MAGFDARSPEDLERVVAWGTAMLLDTGRATASPTLAPEALADLRRILIAQLPETGPIFA